ncbi:MAG: hypothetical protein QOF09_284 [Alphaproteobacteria bacterium]|jgi:hypothetical protein|nr:hypothetical protein [Alphaproteobacteria bacterium]
MAMNTVLELLTGTAGLLFGALVFVLLLGWFLLWRSRRKLKQTT